MEHSSRTQRPRRAAVVVEEEKVWTSFYRHAGDPITAMELLTHLEAEPEVKRERYALYLRCKQTVRRAKERQARAKRIGQFVRLAFAALIVKPLMAMRTALRIGTEVAMEWFPETPAEPAIRRARSLARKPKFSGAQQGFDRRVTEPAAPAGDENRATAPSRSAKTA